MVCECMALNSYHAVKFYLADKENKSSFAFALPGYLCKNPGHRVPCVKKLMHDMTQLAWFGLGHFISEPKGHKYQISRCMETYSSYLHPLRSSDPQDLSLS